MPTFNLFKRKEAPAAQPAIQAEADQVAANTVVATQPVQPKPLVIFDFDGTLADSLNHLIEVLQNFAKKINFKQEINTYQDIVSLRKFKNATALIMHYKELLEDIGNGLAARINETSLFAGLRDAIASLHAMGVTIGIVTTNRLNTVNDFLKLHDISPFVHFVKATGGDEKTRLLQDAVKEHRQANGEVYYVSGRTDYLPVVRKKSIGAKSVGVAWGFDDKNAFANEKVDHYVEDPSQLINIIAKQTSAPEVAPEVAAAAATPAPRPS